MEQSLRDQMPSADDCCLYLAKGAHLYPSVYDHYLDKLNSLQNRGKLSLIPITIFQRFNRRIRALIAA